MTTSTQTCPPLEEIAALLDGRLEAQDRARIIQHLDECPDCYEVFVGAARFLEEDAASEQPLADKTAEKGKVVPLPLGSSTAVRRWLPLAAAAVLALAVGLPVYRAFLAPPRIGSTETLVRPLEGAAGLQDLWVLGASRGEEDLSGYQANSFLVGVYLVDRQVSLDLDAPEKAKEFSQRIANSLQGALRMEKEAGRFYDEWKGAASSLMSSAEAENLLKVEGTGVDLDFLAFGKWAEAARLAAATRSSELFEDRDIRRFPSYFLNADFLGEEEQGSREEEQDLGTAVHQKLRRIDEILDSGDLQEEDFTELANLLGKDGDEGPGIIQLFEDKAAEAVDGLGFDEEGEGF